MAFDSNEEICEICEPPNNKCDKVYEVCQEHFDNAASYDITKHGFNELYRAIKIALKKLIEIDNEANTKVYTDLYIAFNNWKDIYEGKPKKIELKG